MPALDLREITATYPGLRRPALDRVTLSADREALALLGPNGSGKSTLLSVISGLHRPTSGAMIEPAARERIAVVFQTPAIDTLLTVRENLMLAGALYAMSRSQSHARIETLAHGLAIEELLPVRASRLSGGQRRRADLARALVPSPRLLILDEPTTGLDIDARAQFWRTLGAIRSCEPMTIIIATHLADEADRCDRVALLKEGTLVALATPDQLRVPLEPRITRIDLRPGADPEPVRAWLRRVSPDARWSSAGAIVRDPEGSVAGSCPLHAATATHALPTLEDAYLWHTADKPTEPA